MECEYNLLRNAYLGSSELWNKKLDYLSGLAQPEQWGFADIKKYEIYFNFNLCSTFISNFYISLFLPLSPML